MYKYVLNIWDWSDDWHWKNERIILESSHTKEEIIEAYKASCKLTWLQFNHNDDYTGLGWDWREEKKRQIATEYEDSSMTKEQIAILKSHGIDVMEGFSEDIDEDDFYFDWTEHFVEVLIKFIQLSLPDLKIEIVEDDLEEINWFGGLGQQFWYGLFC